jgi:hypothetical protein
MNLVVIGVVAGVVGTVVMALGNLIFARTGVIIRIDVRMIGRMAGGWTRRRFRYGHPSEMVEMANERAVGYGLLTTVASWFFVYPSMELGPLGLRWPEGAKAPLSSLANHLFFGVGMAVGIVLP